MVEPTPVWEADLAGGRPYASTDALPFLPGVLDAQTIKPGRVTLRAENRSGSLVHEVLVVRDDGGKPLALDATHTRLVESKLHRLGEIPELKPGKTGKLTLNLEPGAYLVLCNQPGHYMDGMVAKLTVAP